MLPLAASIAAVGVASAVAYGVYIGGSSITANQQAKHRTVALMQQAAYVLMTEGTDADSDGTKEAAGFGASANAPAGGGAIPTPSAAPKVDGWGNAIGYCPYDNGTSTALANHIAGDNPGTTASISFILISPGKNGLFDTTCAQAKSGTPQGDDFLQSYSVGQALRGGSGIPGFGDPVPDAAQLALVPSPATGEIRLVQATGTLMEWTGSAWQQVGGAAAGPTANFLSPVEYRTDLPASGNSNGDLRVVIAENAIYAWNASANAWQPHLSDSTTTAGTLWAWGFNPYGELGTGNTTSYSSPVQVGGLPNWKQVAAGLYQSVAIKTDGTLWSWGGNPNGQLGLGDTANRSSPVQVGALTNWKQMEAGGYHTVAVKTDGTLWAWGFNQLSGALGVGDMVDRSSPVQVGALTNWKQAAAGNMSTVAVKTDGTLWAWGYNSHGQLGQGDTTIRSSPVQVGGLTNWKQAEVGGHVVAIKTDGTLWTWGYNLFGQLGQGDTANRSSPVQVGGLTTWKQAAAGYADSLALKTDGTLWAWGYNAQGRLGLGDTTNRSLPVQVGGLSNYMNWAQVAVNGGSFALKTNGTLWAWGYNAYGMLGLGDLANRSSPSQVGTLTNWKSVASGNLHSHAIR